MMNIGVLNRIFMNVVPRKQGTGSRSGAPNEALVKPDQKGHALAPLAKPCYHARTWLVDTAIVSVIGR